MEKYYAREDYFYAGDSIFTIPFPYIEKKHIDVFINNVLTTSYDFLTDYSIKINTDIVTGDIISIRRNTPIKERMVVWKNGSILKEESQNLADKQVIYAVQENNDRNEEFVNISETVKDSLFEIQEAKETCLETVDKVEQIRDDVNEQKNQSQIYINNALDNVKDTTDNLLDIIESKSNFVTRNLGEIVTSTIPLNDAGLHLLDGALIQNGVYSAFIDYMAKLFVTNPKLFCTQEEYDQSIADYGACTKYIYNSEAKTVRLPNYKKTSMVPSRRVVSLSLKSEDIYVAPENGYVCVTSLSSSEAFVYLKNNTNDISTQGYVSKSNVGINVFLPVKKGDNIYYKTTGSFSNIKQEFVYAENFEKDEYIYIVLATTTKTDIEINVDNVITDLNSKADKDLANVTTPAQSFKDMSVSWGIPDYENGYSVKGVRNNWIKINDTALVVMEGKDVYAYSVETCISPNANGQPFYSAGHTVDISTQGLAGEKVINHNFLCPKGWYVTNTAENGFSAIVYPLKGVS